MRVIEEGSQWIVRVTFADLKQDRARDLITANPDATEQEYAELLAPLPGEGTETFARAASDDDIRRRYRMLEGAVNEGRT